MPLENKIESILFYKNEPVGLAKLCNWLQRNEEEIREAIEKLKLNLLNRGVVLIEKDNSYMLATAPETAEILNKIGQEELSRDLGKAGFEALSIILYKKSVSRKEIDYIRGVNSTFILRSLMTRGLIEKEEDKNDGRVFIYRPTIALLAHLGLKTLEELPEYEKIKNDLQI